MEIKEYLNKELHLPDDFKDFHDQKEIFKAIQVWGEKCPNNWVDNHIYTVDYFLRFMALKGYKLQKIRSKKLKL